MLNKPNRYIKRKLDSENYLEVYQFNCNGLSKKLTEIKMFLYTRKPDVFCLCETWVKIREPKFIGYRAVWKNRVGAPKGGLVILIREDISFNVKTLTDFDGGNLECQCIQISTPSGYVDIFNAYNPNKNIIIEEFKFYFSQLLVSRIVLGDFNAHSPQWDVRGRSNVSGRSIECALEECNLGILNDVQTITYIDNRTGTSSCLDLCLASHNLIAVGSICQGPDLGSDHFPIHCTFGVMPEKSNLATKKRWQIRRADWEAYVRSLETDTGSNTYYPLSAEQLNVELTEKVVRAANDAVPKTSGYRTFNFSAPWWDASCSTAVLRRRIAKRQLWKCPSVTNLINYKRMEAHAKCTKLKKQRESWQSFVSSMSASTTTRETWRKIRSIGGVHSQTNYPIQGISMSDDLTKSNMFLAHFIKPTPNMNEELPEVTEVINMLKNTVTYPTTSLSTHELYAAISKQKNTAPGPDEVMNIFINKLPATIKLDLLNLYNISWVTGCVPKGWKEGIICAIPKANKDNTLVTGYRPITMLSCIGKLLERIILARMEHYLEVNKLLHKSQFGFRRRKSTLDALQVTNNEIRSSSAQKEFCIVVYLDIAGAFDGVWHQGLIYKLNRLGIDQQMLIWILNYLEGRSVRVRVGGEVSASASVERGLPQGAVLSPTLFNVMMHDMPPSDRIEIVSYADDITLICRNKSLDAAKMDMQNYLDSFSTWCQRWKFVLNHSKSTFQVFTRCRTIPPIELYVENRAIVNVQQQKLLGVILDSPKLNFHHHFSYLKVECTKRVNTIRTLSSTKWGASKKLLRQVYVSFVRSKMEYGGVIFGETSEKNCRKLEVVQNSALRAILGARKTSPILSLEAEAFILPVRLRLRYLNLKSYLKYLHSPPHDHVAEKLGVEGNAGLTTYVRGITELVNKCGLHNKKRVRTEVVSRIPPTVNMSTVVNPELPFICNLATGNSLFNDYLDQNFTNYLIMYTDGSKNSNGDTSAGMYIPEYRIAVGWKLNPIHSIVGAELVAIHQGLLWCNRTYDGEKKILIVTDSKSALLIIGNTHNPNYKHIAHKIQEEIWTLGIDNVKLQWVKSHSGVVGNECADRAANLAHSNNRTLLTSPCFEECHLSLKKSFLAYWCRYWKDRVRLSGKGSFLSDIKDQQLFEDWGELPRVVECSLTRLRIGHAGVGSHLNRFNMKDVSVCHICGVEDSVTHLLMYCSKYNIERTVFRDKLSSMKIPWTLSNILACGTYTKKCRRKIILALAEFLRESQKLGEL